MTAIHWDIGRSSGHFRASSLVADGAKLIRLVNYCIGSARKLVESCLVMSSAAGYARALELLKERYSNEFIIMHAWISKVTTKPVLKNTDRIQLQQYADELMCCKETLAAMNASHDYLS